MEGGSQHSQERRSRRCVLDALVSPTETDLITLIVSLRRVEIGDTRYDFHPDGGVFPTDYKVLVRDSRGKAVPLSPDADTQYSTQHRPFVRMEPLPPGAGIGTLIPLGKLFKMQKPGEYSVLVALSSPGDTWRKWVAEPIKVRVQSERCPSKK